MEQDYLSLAIQQILWEFKLNPDLGLEQKIQDAFRLLDNQDRYVILEYLMSELNNQDFEWQYFNDCVKFCMENKIVPSNFHFLSEYPQIPKNTTEFLEQLTVLEIKQIAKNKGIKGLPTRKTEIIEKIAQQYKLSDLQEEVKDLLHKQMIMYKQVFFKEKCRLIILGIYKRYHALKDNENRANLRIFQPQITHNDDHDTMVFMHNCIMAYPKPNPTTGLFTQLPPYFLGDTARIYYKYQRKNKAEQVQNNIAKQQYLERNRVLIQADSQSNSSSTWYERILWFVSLLWLGLCYLMFTNSFGVKKWLAIGIAIFPFLFTWFWQARKSHINNDDE